MPLINTVLCPVDLTDLARQEVRLALEVCESFGARLILHHNRAASSPAFTRAWEWNKEHPEHPGAAAEEEQGMREILAQLPKTVQAEASISVGPLCPVILELAHRLPADLIVLGSHGWSTPDHASVAERIIDGSPCPVLTMQEAKASLESFRLRAREGADPVAVLVPIDMRDDGKRIAEYALGLCAELPLFLHLMHVAPLRRGLLDLEEAQQCLNDLVPLDMMERVECHVRQGDALEEILRLAADIHPSFMIMGEHARGLFRYLFTRDTARQVLHRSSCPVWFVPPPH